MRSAIHLFAVQEVLDVQGLHFAALGVPCVKFEVGEVEGMPLITEPAVVEKVSRAPQTLTSIFVFI